MCNGAGLAATALRTIQLPQPRGPAAVVINAHHRTKNAPLAGHQACAELSIRRTVREKRLL